MIAEKVGVSRSTVSRVLNGSDSVPEGVARAVRAAADELAYVPNRAGRSLASRRTGNIAMLLPEETEHAFDDPFFAEVVAGIAQIVAPTGFVLSLAIDPRAESGGSQPIRAGVDADIILMLSQHSASVGDAAYGNTPVVFLGRPLAGAPRSELTYFVDADNIGGAEAATRHLIQRGYRRIGIIAGPQDMAPGIDRLEGWRSVIEQAGLEASRIAFGDFSMRSGTVAMRELLATSGSLDAVFAANDQMALGAYDAIINAGLRIPDDVAVMGFDGFRFGAGLTPALSTVDQDSAAIGRSMARIALDVLAGRPAEQLTILPTELVIRQSA